MIATHQTNSEEKSNELTKKNVILLPFLPSPKITKGYINRCMEGTRQFLYKFASFHCQSESNPSTEKA